MSILKKKKSHFKVSMIGAGKLASQLAPALESAGHAISEVYSRHLNNAQALCDQLYEAEVKYDFDFSESDADIFVIAVPDDSIQEVTDKLLLPINAILLHTSGSKPMEVLKNKRIKGYGVMYPLQTFSKSMPVNFKEVPCLVEGSSSDVEDLIVRLSKSISKHVEPMTSGQRAVLHISAVFACNFTNHMISIAEDLTDTHHINFELLKPLIVETMNKSLSAGPKAAQTGPAIREDFDILKLQEKFLKKSDKQLAKIYKLLSQSILNMHN
ncbi:putative short-subunit dehydrogenase-like oxidoreductase (DUF2520 family) [Catalinimonas alkaloidigena]|uniref:Rossmann-like and DUF2520 domain-containing protein n=1 Tax=Catalinimonas alkaloidigena TaxID=1075417 RepID=UPI0024075E2C|nr:Rossmann-like and DUF2520 domain-containing protein [Catalinimonas alkaloidigena]MDF9797397.1 putative short-subunit dehydrogenase-like oxidoreductase (DUF2520 family) [Catalinimonas alkaloidigena]